MTIATFLYIGLATIATLRGHGFAPWVVIGLIFFGAMILGQMFGSMGMHPVAIYRFGERAGWFTVFILALMCLSAPTKEEDDG